MVIIPAGKFIMGTPYMGASYQSEIALQHEVHITKSFYMGESEVTNGLWRKIMGGIERKIMCSHPTPGCTCQTPNNCPKDYTSWDDCQEFIAKLNLKTGLKFRLPTEAEWEYAARAGTTTPYSWGEELPVCSPNASNGAQCDAYSGCYRKALPVKTFSPNPWGLYDMHGNLWEWVSDWFNDYPKKDVIDPTGPSSGYYHVFRGGGYDYVKGACESSYRGWVKKDRSLEAMGFRLVLPVDH